MTPFGIYIVSEAKDDIDCEKQFKLVDKILGMYLKSKDDLTEFKKCIPEFNTDNKAKSKLPTSIKKSESLLKIFNEVTKKIGNRSELYHTINKLKSYKNVLAKMLEAYVYMRMANSSKAQKMLIDIMSENFFVHISKSDITAMPIEEQVSTLIYLFKIFEEDLGNDKLSTALIFYFYYHSSGMLKQEIDDEFELPTGLKSLRDLYRSNRFGKTLPFVWGPWLYDNSSQKEFLSYLENTSVRDLIKQHHRDALLFYRHRTNIDKNDKTPVLKTLETISKSENFNDKFVFYSMVEDDVFYKFVKAHSDLQIGVITAGKRKMYRAMKEVPALKQFAIYNLLLLGDEQAEYLDELIRPYE